MDFKINKKLYNSYVKKEDEVKAVLDQLNKERLVLAASYVKRIKELEVKGGAKTAEIDAEIKVLETKIGDIKKDYDKQIDDVWTEFYNDPLFVGQKERILNAIHRQKQPKSVAKKVVPVASASIGSGVIGKILHKKTVEEQTTKEYYLEHSDWVDGYVKSFKNGLQQILNSGDATNVAIVQCYDFDNMTTTNFIEKIKDGLDASRDIRVQKLMDSNPSLTKELAEMYVYEDNSDLIQLLTDGLYSAYNPDKMAAAVPDYTFLFAGAGALISFLAMFGPLFYNRMKLRSFNRKYNKKKADAQASVEKLLAERGKKTKAVEQSIVDKRKEREVVLSEEVSEGVSKIKIEEDDVCKFVDLKIERMKTVGDLYYNQFMLQMATEGEDTAPAKDNPERVVKVGKPQSYKAKAEEIEQKLKRIDKKLESLENTNLDVLVS